MVYTRLRMCKRRLLTQAQEETNKDNGPIITSKEVNKNNFAIDLETECPRCHDIMTLYSDFNRLCYVCEEYTLFLAQLIAVNCNNTKRRL
ncbi:MAG: hypothetical protein WAM14_20510 [Candidatus Nitrosopolaris sp.]